MAKIISKARQLRLNYQAQLGRPVTIDEVSSRSGVARNALIRLEQGRTERYDGEMLARLCAFYGVGTGDLIVFVKDEIEGDLQVKQVMPDRSYVHAVPAHT